MRTKQGTVFQSLRAIKGFLDEHTDKLSGVIATGAYKRLDDAIALLDTHAADQTGSYIEGQSLTQRQRNLRTILRRDHMAPVARIARADLPSTPEFRPLRMARGRIPPEKLAAAASGMAQVAARYTNTFTAAGLPADFVAQLNTAADDMLASLAERTITKGKRRGATLGLKDKLSEGRKVAAIIDAFVQTALSGDPSLLGNWNVVLRVTKMGTRSAPFPDDGSTPPAPALPAPATPALPAAPTPSTSTTPTPTPTPTPSPETTE